MYSVAVFRSFYSGSYKSQSSYEIWNTQYCITHLSLITNLLWIILVLVLLTQLLCKMGGWVASILNCMVPVCGPSFSTVLITCNRSVLFLLHSEGGTLVYSSILSIPWVVERTESLLLPHCFQLCQSLRANSLLRAKSRSLDKAFKSWPVLLTLFPNVALCSGEIPIICQVPCRFHVFLPLPLPVLCTWLERSFSSAFHSSGCGLNAM